MDSPDYRGKAIALAHRPKATGRVVDTTRPVLFFR